jgi:hypothetical protein
MRLAEEVLQLVGRLNYVWTNTESLMIYFIMALSGVSKEAAIVIFLTLNTSRARLDLLDRLAKLSEVEAGMRRQVLDITGRLKSEGQLRNKYNHCVYSFDESGRIGSTQLMRIADRDDELKYGKVEALDEKELTRINASIQAISAINKDMWAFLHRYGIET